MKKFQDNTLKQILESSNIEKLYALRDITNSLSREHNDKETIDSIYWSIRSLLSKELENTGIEF